MNTWRRLTVSAPMALIWAFGCATDPATADPSDAAAAVDRASEANDPLEASAVSDANADGISDAGEVGLPRPETLPSKQTVRFEVTNSAAEDRLVVTEGASCWPYQVERRASDGAWQTLLMGWPHPDPALDECCYSQNGCDQNGTGPSALTRVAHGSSVVIEWDARELVLSDESYTCTAWGSTKFHWGGLQPVAPGEYRVTIGFEEELPSNCHMADADVARCSTGFAWPSDYGSLCVTTGTAISVFTLPDAGDLTVPVTVP